MKTRLLLWTALRLSQEQKAQLMTRIAMPYNPYEPKPYQRWTAANLFDESSGEILIGAAFWNFVAGDKVYEELLEVFQQAGDILRGEIDQHFSSFG